MELDIGGSKTSERIFSLNGISDYTPNFKIRMFGEDFNLLQMRDENRDLKRRVQKLEALFDHIRQKSSLIDEFIKIAESVMVTETAVKE